VAVCRVRFLRAVDGSKACATLSEGGAGHLRFRRLVMTASDELRLPARRPFAPLQPSAATITSVMGNPAAHSGGRSRAMPAVPARLSPIGEDSLRDDQGLRGDADVQEAPVPALDPGRGAAGPRRPSSTGCSASMREGRIKSGRHSPYHDLCNGARLAAPRQCGPVKLTVSLAHSRSTQQIPQKWSRRNRLAMRHFAVAKAAINHTKPFSKDLTYLLQAIILFYLGLTFSTA
jgi:hypothetical protein